MPLLRIHLGLTVAAFASLSCASGTAYMWREKEFARLPTSGLWGSTVIILPVDTLAAAPGFEGAGELGAVGRRQADSVIAATLKIRAPNVVWTSAAMLRARAEADTSVPHPDSLLVHLLALRALMSVSAPLLEQLEKVVTITQGRYVLAPVWVTYRRGRRRPARAEVTLVLVNVKVGAVAWKSDVAGEDANPLVALAQAIRTLTAGR